MRGFAEKTRAKVVWFSRKERVDGAYIENGSLFFRGEEIVKIEELALREPHNIENALAALACAKLMKINNEAVAKALKTFKGAPHRIETAGVVDGVTYIDDSKGTNVDSAVHAAQCMKNETVLLLGGKDKGYEYAPLFEALKRTKVVRCVIYGENAAKAGYKNVTLTEKFDYAVKIARLLAARGQTVLLSPASASFDEFQSYEERGDRFVSVVRAWQEEERVRAEEERLRIGAAEDFADDARNEEKNEESE